MVQQVGKRKHRDLRLKLTNQFPWYLVYLATICLANIQRIIHERPLAQYLDSPHISGNAGNAFILTTEWIWLLLLETVVIATNSTA